MLSSTAQFIITYAVLHYNTLMTLGTVMVVLLAVPSKFRLQSLPGAILSRISHGRLGPLTLSLVLQYPTFKLFGLL